MLKQTWILLALALSFAGVDSLVSVASAQEVQISGPLAGAPAVRRMREYRRGRFLFEPNVGISLQDPYVRSMWFGAHLGYYFTDWLGLGVWGGYGGVGFDTSLTNQIETRGVSATRNRLSLPGRDNFGEQVGRMSWAAALQLEFIPLRGKLAMFKKLFPDTDFHIFAGAAAVGVEERADVYLVGSGGSSGTACGATDTTCLLQSQTARAGRVVIAPTFGFGLTMMFNNFVGLTIDWRALPFSFNASGTDESGDDDGDYPNGMIDQDDRFFQFNHMVQLGLNIYLPTSPSITD